MSNVLIVTGMHRSGTSLTASFVRSLGIDVGENLLDADAYNPKGYFEDIDFVQLQRSMLQACCNSEEEGWIDWGWTKSEKLDRSVLSNYIGSAQDLIDRRMRDCVESAVWGWKDPRTTLLLDFWNELLPEARYVLVYRFPWDVVDSIGRLNSVAFHNRSEWAIKVWEFYNRHLLEFYRKNRDRSILMSIDRCIREPEQLIQLLEDKFNLKSQSNGHSLEHIYDTQIFSSLSWNHPLVQTLQTQMPESLDVLEELDRAADLPSNFSSKFSKIEMEDRESLPLSLAAKTPEVKTVSPDRSQRLERSEMIVSVVIPCYNGGEFLLEAIASIQRCQEKVYEIIIVNDASTEPLTRKVLNYLRERNYHIIDRSENKGLAEARNLGIQNARGRYILPLDADNKIKPSYITKAIEILDDRPDIGIVYGDMEIFGDKQEIREVPEFDINLMAKGNYIDACAVFRKEVWEDCGGYDGKIPLQLGYEDWDFWLMAAQRDWQFYHVPEVLFEYRSTIDSMVSRCNLPENRQQLIRYICAKHLELYTINFPDIFATKEFELLCARTHADILDVKLRDAQNHQKHLETEFKQTHEQLHEARVDAQKTHDRLREAHQEVNDVHHQLGDTKEEVKQTHARLAEAIADVRRAHTQLAEAREESQQTHERLRQAIEQNQQTHTQLHEAREESQQTHERLRQAIEENRQTHNQLHEAQLGIGQAQFQIQQLHDTIAAMESTKFWKLRIIWFKLKSPLAKSKQLWGRRGEFIEIGNTQGWRYAIGKVTTKVKRKLGLAPAILEELAPAVDPHQLAYQQWTGMHAPRATDLRKMAQTIPTFDRQPTISIIMPVYNTPEKFLRDGIVSVLNQIYPYWELCIADDASTAEHIKPLLEEFSAKDDRIKVVFRTENGHISRASNSAIEVATGEYIALLDHDDLITPDALYEMVLLINQHPDADMIYSDEDKADENNNIMHPFFKPDWCPDSFLSRMYTCHFGMYRKSIIDEIGGFRVGYEGSQDYDLMLRFTEKTDNIYHVPRILYHWRIHAESTAAGEATVKTYAYEAAKKAILEALQRRGEPGEILDVPGFFGNYIVRYEIAEPKRVSIIIPTRDLPRMLDRCLESIFTRTTYANYEVIVVDNGSVEPETQAVFDRWGQQEPDRFKCIPLDIPFNYPKLNNFGVENATGDYILLLNNDTEVVTPDWLEAMVEQAQRSSIGAVGGLLLYDDDRIQHAGVIMGIGGIAGHSHRMFPKDTPGYVCQVKTVANYSAVTGACLMCRRDVFEEVGGLDESLVVAYNDVDFCLKLVDRGYRNIYLPHVVLYHYESKSRGYEDTPEKLARQAKEGAVICQRWRKYVENDPCYNPHLTKGLEDYSINLAPPSIQVVFEDTRSGNIEALESHEQVVTAKVEKQAIEAEFSETSSNGDVSTASIERMEDGISNGMPPVGEVADSETSLTETVEDRKNGTSDTSAESERMQRSNGKVESGNNGTSATDLPVEPTQTQPKHSTSDRNGKIEESSRETEMRSAGVATLKKEPETEETEPKTTDSNTLSNTQIREEVKRVRRQIANKYIKGDGIEIGALHSPLPVPEAANVRYVDRMSVFDLRLQYPEMNELLLVDVDIIDDGEVLSTVDDNSLDFAIANHLIEHCQNPIQTLQNYFRVLKPGGILYLAVPDKRYTFDVDRPVTSLEHLIEDYTEGPERSRISHFEEYVRMVDRTPEKKVSARLLYLLIDLDYSIHFHVWTPSAFTELLLYCQQEFEDKFAIELMQSNEDEFIFVLRKDSKQ
ncbi:glycosyltransferase [Oscillatoriales cyanobacterium LEGE 11467]|uniref:Glycosyltransferase n=1 Tax=Zarconia navalis LEGE 11467 TaxID=1828826 RepID=A0A928ZAH9_9CYAN|nr:glycosyltransferase [Zarconia navalis]MBE9041711.1 glycosyltransferase [Zarconia navalis LEGE 11467]